MKRSILMIAIMGLAAQLGFGFNIDALLLLPDGATPGKLIEAGDQFIFVLEGTAAPALVFNSDQVRTFQLENKTVTIELVDSNLPEQQRSARLAQLPEAVFEVRHKHMVGGCSGRLVVSSGEVRYESAEHSAAWQLNALTKLRMADDGKELKIASSGGPEYALETAPGLGWDLHGVLLDRAQLAPPAKPVSSPPKAESPAP
ncbi:MAG: hypothetical protein ACRD7E_17825 [Bryobacteraceae bacterium]